MPIIVLFGPEPQELRCPRCKREVTTLLRGRSTYVTHLVAVIVTVVCCWILLPWVYCSMKVRDVEHYCPECLSLLGVYHR